MNKKSHSFITSIALTGILAVPTHAAITYIDAQEGSSGNTFATGGSPSITTWIDSTSNTAGVDNASWAKRFGGTPGWTEHNGGDVIQGMVDPVAGNTLGEITTRIGGLADGTYNVYVFFWNQVTSDTQDWIIDAGLTSGSLSAYSDPGDPVSGTDSTTPVNANTLTFTNAPNVVAADSNQNMIGVLLGQRVVSGGSDINVYVDKLTGAGSGTRTIYDGVGYELVPEPSAALLFSLGALALLRRRR